MRQRIAEAVESAAAGEWDGGDFGGGGEHGSGEPCHLGVDGSGVFGQVLVPEHPECALEEMSPRLFSFNSPHGACPKCHGLGMIMEFDDDLVIPDRSKSLSEGRSSRGGCRRRWGGCSAKLRNFKPRTSRSRRLSPWRTCPSGR